MLGVQCLVTNSGYGFSKIEEEIIEKKYNVFFPHTEKNITANGKNVTCNDYWLASPAGASDNSGYLMGVANSGGIGKISYKAIRVGLRPLVCLEEGVKLQKNMKKSTEGKTVYDIVK